MQIHLALDEPPQWTSPEAERLARTAMVHVTPGLNGVSRAVNEAERGLLPAEATIVVGQPCAVDPSSRAGRQVGPLDPAAGAAARARHGRCARARSTSATAAGRRRCARPTRIASSRASARRSRTCRAPRSSASCSPRPISRPQLQPRRRRHLRGLVRARPEPAVAADRRSCRATRRALDGLWHIGASTHPGPGPRRRLGLPRRQAGTAAAARPPGARSRRRRSREAARAPRAVRGSDSMKLRQAPRRAR